MSYWDSPAGQQALADRRMDRGPVYAALHDSEEVVGHIRPDNEATRRAIVGMRQAGRHSEPWTPREIAEVVGLVGYVLFILLPFCAALIILGNALVEMGR